jgi:ATP-dependent 26S proteasome regulatory subunit
VTTISVIVAASPHDIQADGIAAALRQHAKFTLVGAGVLELAEVGAALATVPAAQACALVLVGAPATTRGHEMRWLSERPRLVVLSVEIADDVVRLSLRDPGLEALIDSLHDMVERGARDPLDRITRLTIHPASRDSTLAQDPGGRPLLTAALDWVQALMRRAGFDSIGSAALESSPHAATAGAQRIDTPARRIDLPDKVDVATADAALDDALAGADVLTEPLAALARGLELTGLEFRFVALALAPELDTLYQHFMARLLNQDGWRVGTLGLYAALLGDPLEVREHLSRSGNLARWRLIDLRSAAALPGADEALRLDGSLVDWLLGDAGALERDVRLQRVLRPVAWPGASLVASDSDVQPVATLLQRLQQPATAEGEQPHWLLFNGDQTATWQATLESAAASLSVPVLRVEAARIAELEVAENVETASRLLRLARLTRRPLLLDTTAVTTGAVADDALRRLLADVALAGCRAGILCTNLSWCVGLLGSSRIEVVPDSSQPQLARRRSLWAAAQHLGLALDAELLDSLEQQVPLQADGWERAQRLTQARSRPGDGHALRTQNFLVACRDVASEKISSLAVRLQPHCSIDDIVLPEERKQQLRQIVDGVTFARRVLDEWKFGEQLNYGRGVCALFHGPSGTGKSMAALGIARALNSQVLRIDLSQVVSKYIGETEKHLDAVFRDASQCGAVLLVDEADALLGKRGEIKDAHDRYALQEVSFLLTRIETYDGVAVFTTNARQSIDPAFLRRLRFIVEFPRPDVQAREEIWRHCLGTKAADRHQRHELTDADFRQLARKLDLTGGHIRQIVLQAAFLAAAADRVITLSDVAMASRAELAKLGLPPVVIEPPSLSRVA